MSMSTLAKRNRSMTEPSVTMGDAAKALSRYRNKGFDMFDPQSPHQCRLYLQLRTTKARPDATTFLKFMNSSKQHLTMGARAETKYWGVPKFNFPDGLPEDIERAIVDEDKLAEVEAQGGDMKIDPNTYYVIDKIIDRQRLGMNVLTLKFDTGGTTTVATSSLNDNYAGSDPHAAVAPGALLPAASSGALPRAAPRFCRL